MTRILFFSNLNRQSFETGKKEEIGMEDMVMIQMDHISKRFGDNTALKDVSISVNKGEIIGFLGPSGVGKTTTIKILTGQLLQTKGTATLLNQDTRKINESIYSQIGIVTDNSGLYERMTVVENLMFFAKLLDIDKSRIPYLIERVGLKNHEKKKVSKLSKGMKQRVVLARAILHEPKVLFLDEPTSGLDPSTSLEIHKLLLELKERGTAIFLTTHNMEEATKLCDHVALLNDGYIVEYGTPTAICLKHNEQKEYKVLLKDREETTLVNTAENIDSICQWMKNDELLIIHSAETTLETVYLKVTGRKLQ